MKVHALAAFVSSTTCKPHQRSAPASYRLIWRRSLPSSEVLICASTQWKIHISSRMVCIFQRWHIYDWKKTAYLWRGKRQMGFFEKYWQISYRQDRHYWEDNDYLKQRGERNIFWKDQTDTWKDKKILLKSEEEDGMFLCRQKILEGSWCWFQDWKGRQ